MSKIVGIPRGLFFYKYYPLWQSFFNNLTIETLVSQKTNKQILDNGVKATVDETCIPVKIFMGHVLDIKDKVDYLFIPRYTSVSHKEYICPKFGGLPDMVRCAFDNLPEIIDTEINLRKAKSSSFRAALEIGMKLGKNKNEIKMAYEQSLSDYQKYRKRLLNNELPSEIIDGLDNNPDLLSQKKLTILLLGHVYTVYDSYLNMNVISKIRDYYGQVKTLEMFDSRILRENTKNLNKAIFWQYGTYAIGCINALAQNHSIDGIIYLSSFGCGIDSFVSYMAERRIRNNTSIPFLVISLDEHSGEAGLNTRLEAFFDTIQWRKNHDIYFSSYGQCLHNS